MDNVRSRSWCAVLYPDDPSHINCISIIQQAGYSHALILHDQDLYEDDGDNHKKGDLKKEHFHVVLKMKNARFRDALAKEFGISPNYLEPCRDIKRALLYLVHEGYPDKYQYDVDTVSGDLKLQLETALVCDDEAERVLELVKIIESTPCRTYRDTLVKACEAGLWNVFRKLGAGVKYLIDECNESEQTAYLRHIQAVDIGDFLKSKGG